MNQRLACFGIALLVACGDEKTPTAQPPASTGQDSPAPAPQPPGDPGAYVPLGLNDATILVPAPTAASDALLLASDKMDDGAPLLPRALFERLAVEPVLGAG